MYKRQIPYISEAGLNLSAMIYDIVYFWIMANLILGTFNMIPFGPLDGAKIKDWNPGVWFATFALFVTLVVLMFTGTWSAMSLTITLAELF